MLSRLQPARSPPRNTALDADIPGAAPRPKTIRLLTVGNSFSGNATRRLGDPAKTCGHVLVYQPMPVSAPIWKCTG
jgi:hypothetical protein